MTAQDNRSYVRRSLSALAQGFRSSDKITTAIVAAIIGLTVSLAAIAFREIILGTQGLAIGTVDEKMLAFVRELPWWHRFLPPVVGSVVVALALRFLLSTHRPLGIADVIEANALRDARMPLKDGLVSAVVSAFSLGAGSSAGREGPIVHLGATLAAAVAKTFHFTPALARTLLGCGVAAAVAASFNAPLAGVFFALEVILGHYALHAFAPIVIASVAGTIVSRAYYGDYPAFIIPDYYIASPWEFPAFVLLGGVSAFTAIVFLRTIFLADDIANRFDKVPGWARPPIAGVLLGALAIAFPEVIGVGYDATDQALKILFPLWLLLALVVVKTVATAISLACRFGVGLFSPSLFVGAMVGAAFGVVAKMAFPAVGSDPGLYAIVGMGAVASAVLGAPISTILIVFELTGDYQVTLALMVAVVVANLTTRHFTGTTSVFFQQLERRGLYLEGGRARHLLRQTPIKDLIDENVSTIRQDARIHEIRERMFEAPLALLVVVDYDDRLVGR
ncbi:MAG: chloride channel protein, partial [Alphaproteobacteria bacterium]